MAAKVETLRITGGTHISGHAVVARFATALREWSRKGRLGPTQTSEMRRYTGAR